MPRIKYQDLNLGPAKLTDSRVGAYIRKFGHESWELDALDPATLAGLIRKEIKTLIEPKAWKKAQREQNDGRAVLQTISDRLANGEFLLENGR